MGTGGLGGVHRGFPTPPDVSADLGALVPRRCSSSCSGVKSILDVPATAELLETLGVPVLGYRTDTLPLFYTATAGRRSPRGSRRRGGGARSRSAHWRLGGSAILLGARRPRASTSATLIEEALAEARGRASSARP